MECCLFVPKRMWGYFSKHWLSGAKYLGRWIILRGPIDIAKVHTYIATSSSSSLQLLIVLKRSQDAYCRTFEDIHHLNQITKNEKNKMRKKSVIDMIIYMSIDKPAHFVHDIT